MLRTEPWKRLPLTIRWLKQEECIEFDAFLQPPLHMSICYGPVRLLNKKNEKCQTNSNRFIGENCFICQKELDEVKETNLKNNKIII